jgi:hypothetical protein
VCTIVDIPVGEEWVTSPDEWRFNKVVIKLCRDCRNWAYGAANFEVHDLIDQHAQSQDYVIFTDGSVIKGQRSG